MLEQVIQFIGRLHPMVLHVPIGTLIALLLCECWALARRQPLDRGVRLMLAALACASALASGLSGWILASEPGYSGQTLLLHRWLGVALTAAITLALLTAIGRWPRLYGACLLTAGILMVPVGHIGAEMTHGPGFLTAPFRTPPGARTPPATLLSETQGPQLPTEITMFFENHCVSCHGPNRQRGGLALHTPEAVFAGGDYGPVIFPGDPDFSELLVRLRLPLDDDLRMPPSDRAQPADSEIAVVERWIRDGATLSNP